MPRISILLMLVLISAFYACDHRGKPYPATLSQIESLADTNPEEARPLLDRLRDSLSLFDEEQHMYYDLLDLKVNDKMYVRHTSDSLIKRITAFYETYGDRDKLLESYYYMGRVYRDLNDAPEALKYFQKALDVAGDTRKYRLLSNVYSQMGTLYFYQNVYENAIRMHEKAAQYKLLKGDSTSLSLVMRDIARVYDAINKNDSAVLYYQKAADIAKEIGLVHRYSGISTELGDLHREMGMYDKAFECLFESLKDSVGRNMYPTYSTLGHIYLEVGKLDSADYYLRRCLDSPDLYVRDAIYEYLSLLYERRLNYREAIRYVRLGQQVQDTIRKITDSEEIRKMTSLYNYQKRETENLRLKGENDRMQIRIYRILSLFGLGLSITLLFIYRLKRQKERLARQFEALQREKQEQYERSFQYVEANNAKLNELGTLLSKDHEDTNSLLHVRKELLQVTNEQIQLRRTERDLLESDLRHSDIYMKFHSTNEADQIIREEDWNALRKELDKTYNNFTNRLYQLYSGMSLIELRICYLIKISVKVTDMAKILGRSKPSVSSSRKRLYKKIKGEDGTPNELDELIADL
ncbi:tetratricopeptide repeat protein [Parabacteroides distasonis]|uniref:tetratricopeptide repeat protein n=1 Tax=Parabacteroides distasonis TaxID=823 RepID=UPI0018993087|nr:tetratricopeptide repeat protein [Parabacteroides distasonis]MDB9126945.1 tetratricopeptide repeat protein [Parabacteroides distasonis]MDB9134887.1 tetratricopeptide repeat protein [Parabacteroides distasonis]UBD78857.1 tetratricopeptide repeat protein [Parabacteroides distasonis]